VNNRCRFAEEIIPLVSWGNLLDAMTRMRAISTLRCKTALQTMATACTLHEALIAPANVRFVAIAMACAAGAPAKIGVGCVRAITQAALGVKIVVLATTTLKSPRVCGIRVHMHSRTTTVAARALQNMIVRGIVQERLLWIDAVCVMETAQVVPAAWTRLHATTTQNSIFRIQLRVSTRRPILTAKVTAFL